MILEGKETLEIWGNVIPGNSERSKLDDMNVDKDMTMEDVFFKYPGIWDKDSDEIGDEQFEGGTAEGQQLELGSGTFIPGFEDQLVGVKAGEEKDVVVTFPEEYHAKDLAGREAVFKCTVHNVKVKELPALDDDFAKDTSEFDTLDELKEDLRRNQEKAAEEAAKYDGQNAVLEKLVEANAFDIPDEMIADEAQQMYSEMAQQMAYQGMSIQDYLKYLDKKPEELLEEFRPEAERKVRVRLIVKAVGRAEGLTATEEDVEEESAEEEQKKEEETAEEQSEEELQSTIRTEVIGRKSHKFRNFMLLLLLVIIAAGVYISVADGCEPIRQSITATPIWERLTGLINKQ